MFAWGFQPPLCHCTKGGNKDNILEWIGIGFNSQPWVPIKLDVYQIVEFSNLIIIKEKGCQIKKG